MPETWATSGVDLHLELHRPAGARRPGGRAAARRCGPAGWRPGPRLPSSRTLAADLGVARNTVADVYGQLVAEGWLTARQGSGTRVAEQTAAQPRRPGPAAPGQTAAGRATTCGPDRPTWPRSPAPRGWRRRAGR